MSASDTPLRITPTSAKYQGRDPWKVVCQLERDLTAANERADGLQRDVDRWRETARKENERAERAERERDALDDLNPPCVGCDGCPPSPRCPMNDCLIASNLRAEVERLRVLLRECKSRIAWPEPYTREVSTLTNLQERIRAELGEE